MSDISLEQQIPPSPPDREQDRLADFAKRIPKNVRLRRMRAWLRYWRIRLAKAVLLPELHHGEAHQLRLAVHEDGALTRGYVLMSALSAGIATLGLLQSSTAVVIGAMLISPLMSPIAALGFGFASLDGSRIRDAARVVAIGAGIGILTGILLTWLSPIRNATPEILARTQPTLLDLAVALFSGIAGGYATVIRKGGTAIGVAIATALMPPLAVLGYGIGVLEVRYALGALLLFLTNLAAITFSFAVIARLSGAARPLYAVEWRPRYLAVFVAAFLVLAIPLSLSLMRITQEATMRVAAETAIRRACGGEAADIAQLEVSWPLFGDPEVHALVVAPTYSPNAEQEAEGTLARLIDKDVAITLQQVQTADIEAQARAMVNAAMERTAAGIAADVPPFDKIRASIGLPTRSIWTNTAERTVYVEPVPAPEWMLADYAEVERQAGKVDERWNVRVVPPPRAQLTVALGEERADGAITPQLAVWALQRWGMSQVSLEGTASGPLSSFAKALREVGIAVNLSGVAPAEDDSGDQQDAVPTARVRIYALSPSQAAAKRAADAAAKREAEAEAVRRAAARTRAE